MKYLLLQLAVLLTFNFAYAQTNVVQDTTAIGLGATSTDPSYKFTYAGRSVAHYGLGWYTDPSFAAPMAYLSGYGGIKFFTEGSTRFYIDASGNAGIGTTSPTERLDIGSGNMITSGYAQINTAAKNQIVLGSAGANYGFVSNNTTGVWSLGYGTTPTTQGTPVLSWNSSDNVGIGTTTPDTKLAVNGTIHSREVKVDLMGWPDYVFKPKYNLPALSEVKSYVDQNQHLPDMPSENEVVKDGINLGEIVKLQTKKIEELTLYLIEKDKEVKDQQEAIQQSKIADRVQQDEIDQLKQSLEALTKEIHKN